MIRVLFDTNIYISAIIFGGLPAQLLALAVGRLFKLVTSPVLLDELDERLRTRFMMPLMDAIETRVELEELCDVVSTTSFLSVVTDDPDDDRVLECVRAGHADYIVTGDKHLLHLHEFLGIAVITPRRFMDIVRPSA